MQKNKNFTKIFGICLLLFGIIAIFSFGINSSSAAQAPIAPHTPNIYVNTNGNDDYDGLSSTWTSGINGPKATIKNATGTVSSDGTVHIASGTYSETKIQINTNMNILGENQETTIVDGQKKGFLIFKIASGLNVNIANLTLKNAGSNVDGSITNGGTLNVENSTFIGSIVKTGYAIHNLNGGILTVKNSTIKDHSTGSGYGGAIHNDYGAILIIKNSALNENSAYDSFGGAIYNSGTLTVENSTFHHDYADTNGGAIYNNGILTVRGSTFTNSMGFAIYNDNGGTSTVNFNRFVENEVPDIYNNNGNVNAENNWWGTNFMGTNPQDAGRVNFPVTKWIVLTVTANPTTINKEDNSTITADLLHDNLGNYLDPSNGHIPYEDITVNFSSDILGTITPETGTITNGSTNSTFTGHSSGVSAVSAMVDDQTVTTNVIITSPTTKAKTNITVKNVTGVNNQRLSLNATLTDIYGHLLAGETVLFNVNGHNYNAVTGNDGVATINYIPYGAGNYNFTVNYLGNNNYTASEGTGLLTVNPSAYLYLQIKLSNDNPKVGESFTLTYKLGNKGPDNANNVTMTMPLPSGFTVSKITGDGNWTYNSADNTITWTLTNVTIGDPYLYITGKTNTNGFYVFGSNITSETYNLNTEGITPITITATDPTNPIIPINPNSTNSTTVNAATTTIPMQQTGIPIAGLILGILSVIGGSILSRKK